MGKTSFPPWSITYCMESRDSDAFVYLGNCTGQEQQIWYWKNSTLRNMHLGEIWCLDHTKPWSTWIIGTMKRCVEGRASQQWTTVEEYPDSQGLSNTQNFVISAKDRYFPLRPFLRGLTEDRPRVMRWRRLGGVQVVGQWKPLHGIIDNQKFETYNQSCFTQRLFSKPNETYL